MPQSLSKIYLHVIFSTKDRCADILPRYKTELHNYIGGTLNAIGCQSIIVGGMADHVHMLFCMSRIKSIAATTSHGRRNITANARSKRNIALSSKAIT